jgi:phosphoglucosamine mutase
MAASLEQGLASSAQIGRAKRVDDSQARYIEFAKRTFPRNLRLEGLRIVIDCAHGAAYKVAPEVLWELGADIVSMGVTPNGTNINLDCGSTAPQAMCNKVREVRADFGIALDGDADRVVMADEHGRIIDGDQILALIAKSWSKGEKLKGGGVVGTVMSNAGLARYLKTLNLSLARSAVGDRYVLEEMAKGGFNVGGEQSGHIILSDFSTTGDGAGAGRKADVRSSPSVRAAAPGAGECALQEGLAPGRRTGQVQHRIRQCQAGRVGPGAGAQVGHRTPDPGDGGRRG